MSLRDRAKRLIPGPRREEEGWTRDHTLAALWIYGGVAVAIAIGWLTRARLVAGALLIAFIVWGFIYAIRNWRRESLLVSIAEVATCGALLLVFYAVL
jgi:hypothetical protein